MIYEFIGAEFEDEQAANEGGNGEADIARIDHGGK